MCSEKGTSRCFVLSSKVQILCTFTCIFIGVFFVVSIARINKLSELYFEQKQQINHFSMMYRQVLSNIDIVNEELKNFVDLVDVEDGSNEHKKVLANLALLQSKIEDFYKNNTFNHKIEMLRKEHLMVQRDLLENQVKQYKQKLVGEEQKYLSLKEQQGNLVKRFDNVIQGKIDDVNSNLYGVQKTLHSVSFSLNKYAKRKKKKFNIGGPFFKEMPEDIEQLTVDTINIRDKIDYLDSLNYLKKIMPLGSPLEKIRITSVFGAREDPFRDMPARHEAVDLGGIVGEPVFATAPGKVIKAGSWGWYGNMVEIDHGMGFRTRYAHLDKIFVSKDDAVQEGDKIGVVGNTGRSTGAHLHYEVRVNGYAVDPVNFIGAKRNVFKN
ncbi:MAG: peptidoglycan DD-metalloendopeptidase family protein [Alphaproteobacteria bacterium]|nr:peptidoglycan DD-metalloendopeptidase family protein [Alphaproteobacteria bacterium]